MEEAAEILQRSGKLVSTQVAPEPKAGSEKTEKQPAGREAATSQADTAAQGSTTTTQLASATTAASPLGEEVALVLSPPALTAEAVISHDTVEPLAPEAATKSPALEEPDGYSEEDEVEQAEAEELEADEAEADGEP